MSILVAFLLHAKNRTWGVRLGNCDLFSCRLAHQTRKFTKVTMLNQEARSSTIFTILVKYFSIDAELSKPFGTANCARLIMSLLLVSQPGAAITDHQPLEVKLLSHLFLPVEELHFHWNLSEISPLTVKCLHRCRRDPLLSGLVLPHCLLLTLHNLRLSRSKTF